MSWAWTEPILTDVSSSRHVIRPEWFLHDVRRRRVKDDTCWALICGEQQMLLCRRPDSSPANKLHMKWAVDVGHRRCVSFTSQRDATDGSGVEETCRHLTLTPIIHLKLFSEARQSSTSCDSTFLMVWEQPKLLCRNISGKWMEKCWPSLCFYLGYLGLIVVQREEVETKQPSLFRSKLVLFCKWRNFPS